MTNHTTEIQSIVSIADISIIEREVRKELNKLYDTLSQRINTFVTERIKQLSSGSRISEEEFTDEVKAFSKQLFVEKEQLFEAGVFSETDFDSWCEGQALPIERFRNEVLLTIYEVYLWALESDSQRESARLLTFSEMLSVMSTDDV